MKVFFDKRGAFLLDVQILQGEQTEPTYSNIHIIALRTETMIIMVDDNVTKHAGNLCGREISFCSVYSQNGKFNAIITLAACL